MFKLTKLNPTAGVSWLPRLAQAGRSKAGAAISGLGPGVAEGAEVDISQCFGVKDLRLKSLNTFIYIWVWINTY